jgi:hypothetical protein
MNLLLLIYAMIAGLAGFNAGPSAAARMAAVAEAGSVSAIAEAPNQAAIAAKTLAARVTQPAAIPAIVRPDARRVVFAVPVLPAVASGRAAPERRLE